MVHLTVEMCTSILTLFAPSLSWKRASLRFGCLCCIYGEERMKLDNAMLRHVLYSGPLIIFIFMLYL